LTTTVNLGIVAHVDAGKTSLTERLLYAAGVIDRIAGSMTVLRAPTRWLWSANAESRSNQPSPVSTSATSPST